jgi:hypothetical protein
VTVPSRVHMPSLGGANGWLNSEPLDPAELRGHVVLVNFWTLTCINWLRSTGGREEGPSKTAASLTPLL